jgi:phage repressor protein C with HTH and peptisase S24 domain
MTLGTKIEVLLQEKGWSQAELARRVGVSTQSIWKLVSGGATGSRHLHKIARALETTPEYLTGETSARSPDHVSRQLAGGASKLVDFEEMAAERGLLPIRHLDLAFGMGATYLDNPVEEEMRYFPEAFIRAFTAAPPALIYFAEGAGDSMMPTIHSNDVVIIDTSAKRITMGDQIWACNYAGLGMIKRLRPMPDGGVKILSDNPSVPAETAYDGELSLVGRVVGVARKI